MTSSTEAVPPIAAPPGLEPVSFSWHTVNGRPIQGLVFDPGAADGLVGTETLRSYLKASGQKLEVLGHSATTFRGIEGTGVPSNLRVRVPFSLDGTTTGTMEMDTIGGNADRCPFLLPNRACVSHRCITIHCAFLRCRCGPDQTLGK